MTGSATGSAAPAGPLAGSGSVVVVGGGVIGLCLAYYLAEAGLGVDLIERRTVGSAASRGNAGWVCESHSAPIPAPGIMSYAVRPVPAIVAANNHHADTAADRLQAMREYLGSLMERAVDDTDGDVNEALVEALASIDMAASGMWSST